MPPLSPVPSPTASCTSPASQGGAGLKSPARSSRISGGRNCEGKRQPPAARPQGRPFRVHGPAHAGDCTSRPRLDSALPFGSSNSSPSLEQTTFRRSVPREKGDGRALNKACRGPSKQPPLCLGVGFSGAIFALLWRVCTLPGTTFYYCSTTAVTPSLHSFPFICALTAPI